MSSVAPADSTVAFIRKKIRRLTASPSESALSTSIIDEYINNFYNNDFPYAIKIDQQRSVYTFFTEPYRDRYPLDVNYNMGVRAPVYVEGILGTLFKDRTQFFNLWPRWPTKFQQGGTSISGIITNVVLVGTSPVRIINVGHGLNDGDVITIDNVVGTVELNNQTYTVTIINANAFDLDGTDSSNFSAYVSGGTWEGSSRTYIFTLPGPFLSKEVVIGGVENSGIPISINDDGNGNLIYMTTNQVTSVPLSTTNPAVPGMYNINNGNPGLINPTIIGNVNYITGEFNFTLPEGVSLGNGELFTIWVSQYQPGRPYCLLFWNNELTIRPIPKLIHKVEVETYLTPVQFIESTDNPILNQWAQYIAYGAAREILRDRQDLEGVSNLEEGFMRQEALVLERQGIEEIGTPNYQLFNSTQPYTVYGGWGAQGTY